MEIIPVGGFGEIGRNMSLIKVKEDSVILDMGLHLDNLVSSGLEREQTNFKSKALINAGAVPNINLIKNLNYSVRAIIPSHGHLDHVGAIPYLAGKYKAKIMSSPLTIEIIKTMFKSNKFKIKNKLKVLQERFRISKNIEVELIPITHSIPQANLVVLRTSEGTVVYANDFKIDNAPTLGKSFPYKRLKQLGKEGVDLLISECIRAEQPGHTPSESVAKELLRDAININKESNLMCVTTFASHIARLKSIYNFSLKLGRTPIFVGRSLAKYVNDAKTVGIDNFLNDLNCFVFRSQVKKILKKVNNSKKDYLVVLTGHQGEENSVLRRVAENKTSLELNNKDSVIFSCFTIPTKTNIKNRAYLEALLKRKGVKIMKDVHVSGHARADDHKLFLELLKPKNAIPSHGDIKKLQAYKKIADSLDIQTHIKTNGKKLIL